MSKTETILISNLRVGDIILVWGREAKVLDIIKDDININQFRVQYLDANFQTTLAFWGETEVKIVV